jgi:hypothetical protein
LGYLIYEPEYDYAGDGFIYLMKDILVLKPHSGSTAKPSIN